MPYRPRVEEHPSYVRSLTVVREKWIRQFKSRKKKKREIVEIVEGLTKRIAWFHCGSQSIVSHVDKDPNAIVILATDAFVFGQPRQLWLSDADFRFGLRRLEDLGAIERIDGKWVVIKSYRYRSSPKREHIRPYFLGIDPRTVTVPAKSPEELGRHGPEWEKLIAAWKISPEQLQTKFGMPAELRPLDINRVGVMFCQSLELALLDPSSKNVRVEWPRIWVKDYAWSQETIKSWNIPWDSDWWVEFGVVDRLVKAGIYVQDGDWCSLKWETFD